VESALSHSQAAPRNPPCKLPVLAALSVSLHKVKDHANKKTASWIDHPDGQPAISPI